MAIFQKGLIPWQKGRPRTDEQTRKQSDSLKARYASGLIPWNKGTRGLIKTNSGTFKKDHITWNKGKANIYSKEYLEKLRISHTGKLGKQASNWRGGMSRAYQTGYYSPEYKQWRRDVFIRDEFTCQRCGIKHIYITAHHIKPWSKFPEFRFAVGNGITLCEDCHCAVDEYRARFRKKEAPIV